MNILLATDGSENSEAAAQLLTRLPQHQIDSIVVASVIQVPALHFTHRAGNASAPYVVEQTKTYERVHKGHIALLESPKTKLKSVIREGHPGKTILRLAEEYNIDLIVVGAVGDSLIDQALLGSTGSFVVKHALQSVLVVRTSTRESVDLRFVVAHDGSDAAKCACIQLARTGWASDASVSLLRVVPLPTPTMSTEEKSEIRNDIQEDLRRDLSDLRTHDEISALNATDFAIESGHVGRSIVKFAEEQHADVIVMGDTGRGLVGRFLLGSSSCFVIDHAPCSVLIGRGNALDKKD